MSVDGISLKASDFIIRNNEAYITNKNYLGTPGMMLIFATWCGHCHRFLPVFNQLQKQLGDDFPIMSIEHSELENDKALIQALDFKGYPTIKFFDQKGKIIGEYTSGDRSKSALLAHICDIYHHCVKFH
jgi:thiol-disulfide isomerase/thioredoxin